MNQYEHSEKMQYFMNGQKVKLSDKDYQVLVTEDSKSGYQFYQKHFENENIKVETAASNSAITKFLAKNKNHKVFIIADGAAFGPYISHLMDRKDVNSDLTVCLPESFEWLILKSDILNDSDIMKILEHPADYIDSSDYNSWEQYFTDLLMKTTNGQIYSYSKSKINPYYINEVNSSRIIALIADRNIQ